MSMCSMCNDFRLGLLVSRRWPDLGGMGMTPLSVILDTYASSTFNNLVICTSPLQVIPIKCGARQTVFRGLSFV
jgi:hypothetical protein